MMKAIAAVLLCASTLFPPNLQAVVAGRGIDKPAGIRFDHGSWSEVLARAKEEGKLVFVDVYTSWCGPCKQMVAETFPRADVGKVFNASFINYEIDAEKGEGPEITRAYDVGTEYPTYLFVGGDGKLVYRTGGYMPAESFLRQAAIALQEKDDPKPLGEWVREYQAGKRDKAFLLGYLKKRARVKMASPLIIEEVFDLLNPDDLKNRNILTSMLFLDTSVQYVPDGKLFNYVIAHHKRIDAILGNEDADSLSLLQIGTDNYFRTVIIQDQDEHALAAALAASRRLGRVQGESAAKINVNRRQMVMEFDEGGRSQAKIIAAAQDYVGNGLDKLDLTGMMAADAADYETSKQTSSVRVRTTASDAQADERFLKADRMISVAYGLRDAAEAIYDAGVTDPKVLAQAQGWVQQANGYLHHFSISAVYAGLLFRQGKQQQAVEVMKDASRDPDPTPEMKALLLANVHRLERGEAPRHLWSPPLVVEANSDAGN